MARDKKTMIGFDPLAWLDDEGEEKEDKSVENESAEKEDIQVLDESADTNVVERSEEVVGSVAEEAQEGKMIDLLGAQLDEKALLKGYELAADTLSEIVENFYADLFEQYPAVQPLFENTDTNAQAAKLIAALRMLIENIHNQKTLKIALSKLGVQHQGYGVLPEQYAIVAELLVLNCKKKLAEDWTPAINDAWLTLLSTAAKVMCEAYSDEATDDITTDDSVDTVDEINNTDDSAMIDSDQPVLQLHGIQDIGKSQALKNDMLALVNENDEINIEASSVERIDGSALQLLCSLFQYAKDNNLVIHWLNPSDALIQSAETLGLKSMLELN